MLELHDVHAYYGESHILHGVSLTVTAGQVLALIGRNGMGKTTLLRSVMGLAQVRKGTVLVAGRPATGLPPYAVARMGCTIIPEDRGIFPWLTVAEHLRLSPMALGIRAELSTIYTQFPFLQERARQPADSLSGGERAILAVARSLLAKPKVLLVDELSAGVQPNVVQELGKLIQQVAAEGTAVVLVDQDARFALRLAKAGCLMEKGRIVLHGPASEMLQDEGALQRHLIV